jgi:hypothetical protein
MRRVAFMGGDLDLSKRLTGSQNENAVVLG